MSFSFGSRSRAALSRVHPDLVAIATHAIAISSVDFGVKEGERTLAQQKIDVAKGVSHTLDSLHIPQKDRSGKSENIYGHALDLVPWINGAWAWDWPTIYHIADAMTQAATALGFEKIICWGGVWDKYLGQYCTDAASAEAEEHAYVTRTIAAHKAAGTRPTAFIDGPHFQVYRLR